LYIDEYLVGEPGLVNKGGDKNENKSENHE
jgi:hypothetical protein